MSVLVRVTCKGAWHVDIEVSETVCYSAGRVAAVLRGEGCNARVVDDFVIVDATPTPIGSGQRELSL